jgi:nitrite reductase/ring-hydroxylating ferredoxin subunit
MSETGQNATAGTGVVAAPRARASRVQVARFDELEDRAIRLVTISSREIGVIRWGDDVFAVRNVCPHVAGPACGLLRPRLTADATQQRLVADETSPMLVCAWHKWEFDLRDGGRALFDPQLHVKTYPVEIAPDGTVWITI